MGLVIAIVGAVLIFRWQVDSESAVVLQREAEELHEAGSHKESAERYRVAALAAEEAGDTTLALGLRAQSGVCLKMDGRPGEALVVMEAALKEAKERGVARVEGLALGNLARIHDLLGQDEEGLAYRDALVEFALRVGDSRLAVLTLEQAALAAGNRGDGAGSKERLERALALDPQLQEGDRRRPALLRQKADLLAKGGEDLEAILLWSDPEVGGTAVGQGRQAEFFSALGLHQEAADFAWQSALAFGRSDELGAGRKRDFATLLHIEELARVGLVAQAHDRIDKILESGSWAGHKKGGPSSSLLPFQLAKARFDLASDRPEGVAEKFEALEEAGADPIECQILRVVALIREERWDEAWNGLEGLPQNQAKGLLTGWLLLQGGTSAPSSSDVMGNLQIGDGILDGSLAQLRRAVPFPLPSAAMVRMDVTLQEVGRLRAEGQEEEARQHLQQGVVEALLWHGVEQRGRVTGLAPQVLTKDERGAVVSWVEGGLPEGHALMAVIPGEHASYVVLCRGGFPVTTFPLPPLQYLEMREYAVIEALLTGDVGDCIETGYAYYKTLFPPGMREDLRGISHITAILPDALFGVPLGVLAISPSVPNQPPVWFVYDHVVSYLPHVLVKVGSPPLQGEWMHVGEPAVHLDALEWLGERLLARHGQDVVHGGRLRKTGGDPDLTGDRLGAGNLWKLAGQAGVLELSVPAVGGGRLGGLLLAPDLESDREDERQGFVPWHRMASLPLPGTVLLDRSRFPPDESEFGAAYAVTCLMTSVRRSLLSRWPSPLPPEILFQRIVDRFQSGLDLADAVNEAQRDFLIASRDKPGTQHPAYWGTWMAFESPRSP